MVDPFPAMLEEGRQWELAIAERLVDDGIAVEVPPMLCRPDIASREAYGDAGDLFVRAGHGGKRTLSVKSRSLDFTGPNDFPFSYVIVDTIKAYDRVRVSAVIIVSQKTGGVVVVPATTKEHWRDTRWATVDGWKPAYECPKGLAKTWGELIEWLKTT